ncbi:MAG TPA: hypothetical protein VL332_02110 [Candidatus Saccharimonadaceae bacterium]|nr:hypothetical protein [Candidatus Saccharimonadaceae bacterium]
MSRFSTAMTLAIALTMTSGRPAAAAEPDSASAVAAIQADAAALRPLFTAPVVRRFLDATRALPRVAPRTVLVDSSRTHAFGEREAAALSAAERAPLITRSLDESFYYNTRYGTPLAYARPLEILAEAGFKDVTRRRIADFGYGTIGHLRLLASLGADVTGIEVDPVLRALYSWPGDQGAIEGVGGAAGRLRVLDGRFPAEAAITGAVGEGYDLFISKNTLKNGYIHPEREVDPRRLVHLGVDDSTFVRTLARILRPGGFVLIYNLCPAPAPPDQPYIPWADGRCPFARALWEANGFRVIAFDKDDTKVARAMAHALGWDQGASAMNLEKDLFGTYTLLEKTGRAAR